jgi:hypothetical protein
VDRPKPLAISRHREKPLSSFCILPSECYEINGTMESDGEMPFSSLAKIAIFQKSMQDNDSHRPRLEPS